MEHLTKKTLHLVSGRFNRELAENVATSVDNPLGPVTISSFANGEIHCQYGESIRGTDVFIFQGHGSINDVGSINDAIMEQLIMVDAARRASAKRITVVAPYFGYSRQDRKSEGREPISARLMCDMFAAAGAQRVLSVDLHSGQTQGFFDGPVDHLTAMPVLSRYLEQMPGDLVIASPDAGRVKVAERYAVRLHADLAFVHKRRVKGEKNNVEARGVIGDVAGKTCVLLDDMIDTAGTIVAAAELLKEQGAAAIHAAATHAIFSGPAVDRLKNSVIEKIIVTDTVPLPPEKQFDKVEVLTVAPLIASAIRAIFDDQSVSRIFSGEHLS